MKPVTLKIPVFSGDKKLLMPAGAVITDDILQELAERGQKQSWQTCSLLDYGSIHADFLTLISKPPYQVIFSQSEKRLEVLGAMQKLELSLPILGSLEYFKIHDFHTYRHMLMIFGLSQLLAIDLLPDLEERFEKVSASPTHDIGKMVVPLPVLTKREPLTNSELQVLRQHTVMGGVLLAYYLGDCKRLAVQVARDHHEKKNGGGYPRGIEQDDHLVEIVAACDVYDALISPRPYRPVSYDNRTALEVITEMAVRGEIGWDVVKALVALNRIDKPNYVDFEVSLEKRGVEPAGNSYGIIAEDACQSDSAS